MALVVLDEVLDRDATLPETFDDLVALGLVDARVACALRDE